MNRAELAVSPTSSLYAMLSYAKLITCLQTNMSTDLFMYVLGRQRTNVNVKLSLHCSEKFLRNTKNVINEVHFPGWQKVDWQRCEAERQPKLKKQTEMKENYRHTEI